jgi:excisionase family DNA binding protein
VRLCAKKSTRRAGNGHKDGALLTPEQLAEKLKIPVSWVYEQSRQKKIPTHRLGRYIRFDIDEVLESQKRN